MSKLVSPPLNHRDHEVLSSKQGVQYWLSKNDFSDKSIEELIEWLKLEDGTNLKGDKCSKCGYKGEIDEQ